MKTTTTIHWNKGNIAKEHNERDEKLCSHEKHIDLDNEYGDSFHEVLYRQNINDAYEEIFGNAIEEFNAKQKRKDRKKTISSYMKEIQNDNRGKRQTKKINGKTVIDENARKGKQLEYEITVKVGNTERKKDNDGHVLYDTNGQHIRVECLPRDLQKIILYEYCNTFQEANPNFKVTNIDLHGDEGFYNKQGQWEYSCIHPHITFIPIATGFKQGLSVQNSMNKALSQMGCGGVDGYDKWAKKEQQRLEQITIKKYKEYCLIHHDFYQKYGDLEIIHPVHERAKNGDMDKEIYTLRQELSEDFLSAEIEQNQTNYALESISMELDNYKSKVDDYKHSLNNQITEIEKQLSKRENQLTEKETELVHRECVIETTKAKFDAYKASEIQSLQEREKAITDKENYLKAFSERTAEIFSEALEWLEKVKNLYNALDATHKALYKKQIAQLDESLLPRKQKQKQRSKSL